MKKLYFLSLLGILCLEASAGPILQSSPGTGTPLSVNFTWQCPVGTVSTQGSGTDKNWLGYKATSGKQSMSGITVPGTYQIDCITPDTTATTVTLIPSPPNADGSTLPTAGYHIYWDVSKPLPGAKFANVITFTDPCPSTGCDIPVPGLPTGTVYLAADAFIAGGAKSNLSDVLTKTIVVGGTVSDKIEIVMPGAPKATVK
jgi:hypothetical protein